MTKNLLRADYAAFRRHIPGLAPTSIVEWRHHPHPEGLTLRPIIQDGERIPLVDLLGIPHRWRGPAGTVHCAKRRGASKSLRSPAQRIGAERMPFLSALEDRAWRALDQGWELLEHRDRAAEAQRRHEAEGRVRGLFAGEDDLTRARCAEEIARLRARYPLDPKEQEQAPRRRDLQSTLPFFGSFGKDPIRHSKLPRKG